MAVFLSIAVFGGWFVAIVVAYRLAARVDREAAAAVHPSAVADPWPVVATTAQAAAAERTNIDPAIGHRS